jgi:hypothetical protein
MANATNKPLTTTFQFQCGPDAAKKYLADFIAPLQLPGTAALARHPGSPFKCPNTGDLSRTIRPESKRASAARKVILPINAKYLANYGAQFLWSYDGWRLYSREKFVRCDEEH